MDLGKIISEVNFSFGKDRNQTYISAEFRNIELHLQFSNESEEIKKKRKRHQEKEASEMRKIEKRHLRYQEASASRKIERKRQRQKEETVSVVKRLEL